MALNQSGIANPHLPTIDGKEFRMSFLHRGITMFLRSKNLTAKCADGWDDISGTHDPDCQTCTGSSGYTYVPKRFKGVYQIKKPHAVYNTANLATSAGKNERSDATVVCDNNIGRLMFTDDLITIPGTRGRLDIEYTVQTAVPEIGTKNRVIFWKIYLMKAAKVDIIAATSDRRL